MLKLKDISIAIFIAERDSLKILKWKTWKELIFMRSTASRTLAYGVTAGFLICAVALISFCIPFWLFGNTKTLLYVNYYFY